MEGYVYLIHFDKPYKHAKHYSGWAKQLDKRLAHHSAGTGARLMQVIRDAGIGWKLARLWRGTRDDERRLKNLGGGPRTCPICALRMKKQPLPVRFMEELPLPERK